MFTNSFSVLFYLKRRSNYVSGDLPIYLRITASGHRIELATKRTCEPERWNSAAGRKSGTKQDTRHLNAYLDTLQSKVYKIQQIYPDDPNPYLELQDGRAIVGKTIIALNGVFRPEYSGC